MTYSALAADAGGAGGGRPGAWGGCVGLGGEVVGSLGLRASSPLPPLARSPFPQGGRLISGSCFAVAGVGALGWVARLWAV